MRATAPRRPGAPRMHAALKRIVSAIGDMASRVVLGLAYFGVIAPLGWLLRRMNRLRYRVGFEPSLVSYRAARRRRIEREDLEPPQ